MIQKQDIIDFINKFHKERGRYPTVRDFNKKNGICDIKTVQRKFGGLVAIKKEMGIEESDMRTGSNRSKQLVKMEANRKKFEDQIYKHFCEEYGRAFVHRDYKVYDDTKFNIDLAVHIMNKTRVDIERIDFYECFFPQDVHSFFGCLNIKNKKYQRDFIINSKIPSTITYVQMNRDLKDIPKLMSNKKIPMNGKVISIYDLIP